MLRIRLFHWKAEEAAPLIARLTTAGHSVEYEEKPTSYSRARDTQPDAFVIDLSRLPSHGRDVGVFLRGSKATRHIPTVFVEGDQEKVEAVRRLLPDATYTSLDRLIATLNRVRPLIDPVRPPQMMERYAGRTAAQKLGIGKDSGVAVIDPPSDYAKAIGKLPEGAWFEEAPNFNCTVTLWFAHDRAGLQSALPEMRKAAARSRLWILWRKSKKDGLDGNLVRHSANDVGLVDYKICSVNETWSGMAFAVKKPR